ncbi:hypothetical protein [Mesoterricola silvestris]|nr:hypothetical protein [Mesoterricola silvestris]
MEQLLNPLVIVPDSQIPHVPALPVAPGSGYRRDPRFKVKSITRG